MSKNDILDDLLDNSLLSNESPRRAKNTPNKPVTTSKQKALPGKTQKSGNINMMADSDVDSDKSEVDMDKLMHSLGGLDDMDADLFADAFKKKAAATKVSGKPITPRLTAPQSKGNKSPTRVQSPTKSDPPTSPPESARSLKRKPVKPPPSSSTQQQSSSSMSLPQAQPDPKPGTAPGKMSDISAASENLKPGQKSTQRPETAPKLKSKFDFDYDPDDPLAGILSDETDDITESDRPRSATKKPAATQPQGAGPLMPAKGPEKTGQLESPRKRNLMDRPPTRSGASDSVNDPVISGNLKLVDSEGSSTKTAVKTGPGIFSDSDNDLLELEGRTSTPAQKAKPATTDGDGQRPARSVLDSLLGKSSGAASILEPKEKKDFVLDRKYTSLGKGENVGTKEEDDDGFSFGNYQPSAASSSRPNSRRSVRFQDDDIFGSDPRPSPRNKSPGSRNKNSAEMDWLELAVPSASGPPASAALIATGAKPPVPAIISKPPGSPKKTTMGGAPVAAKIPTANSGQSAKAWLGLADSESDDDELFKPKKSSARSASLPQSPAMSATASPRVMHKKPTKRDPSPKPLSGTSDGQEQNEEDDWLSKVKSQRQKVLAKERSLGDSAGILDSVDAKPSSLTNEILPGGPLVSAEIKGSFPGDLFSPIAGHRSASWESPRTPLSVTVSGGQGSGGNVNVTQQNPTSDPRLKFSSALIKQDQVASDSASSNPVASSFSVTPASQQLHAPPSQQQQAAQTLLLTQAAGQLRQSSQVQQQMEQLQLLQQQEARKTELFRKQQELQQMLQDVQRQFDSVTRSQPAMSSSLLIPTYNQITSSVELPDSTAEAHIKIRKLELEKTYLDSLLESLRRRYEEEMYTIENSYKNRLQILEESNRKKEMRLREENEELMQQHLAKVRQLEQEKSDQSAAHYRRLEDMERDKAQDLEKLKEQHRLSLAAVKREHEEALGRLASTKNQEINMMANANDTSRTLTAAVRDLGDLQVKVEAWNKQGLDEREIMLRSKDEQLKMLQERLKRQEEENERERKRVEELIARIDAQLREQTRATEEERWKLKQDQSRAEAVQRSLDEERRLWLEQQARERALLEKTKENLLEEQHSSTLQITEERRLLAEERAKFQIEQRTVRDKLHQETMKRSQAEVEYEVLTKAIAEEKVQQALRMKELQREEERMTAERQRLERERSMIDQEKELLAKQARQIREQSEEIDRVTEAARLAQQEGEQAMQEAYHINSQLDRREADVDRKLSTIKLMEEHISEEKLRLAREKKEVEDLRRSHLCVNCRSPQNGITAVPLVQQNGYHHTPLAISALDLSPSGHHLAGNNPLAQIAASIASDRAVRMLKIQAIKDKEFLEEENFYLEALRHTPYHSATSKS